MRVGKEKVTIKKKYYKEPKDVKVDDVEDEIELENKNAELPPPNKSNSFMQTYNSKLQKETTLHSDNIILEYKIDEENKQEGN